MIFIHFDNYTPSDMLFELWHRDPSAAAYLAGSPQYPNVAGIVFFYETRKGVYVMTDIYGLPQGEPPCDLPVFGFHIHTGGACTGNASDPLADTDGHFNPQNCPHPFHAGDLPPLFGCDSHAWMTVLTDRFTIPDIIGKTVVVHSRSDDFRSQPSGDSGTKIACGKITVM